MERVDASNVDPTTGGVRLFVTFTGPAPQNAQVTVGVTTLSAHQPMLTEPVPAGLAGMEVDTDLGSILQTASGLGVGSPPVEVYASAGQATVEATTLIS